MSGLENLRTRLDYNGGIAQNDRLREGKLKSLEAAISASYQSAVITLPDQREFACLINPDVIENDYENKFLSIPYEAKCINNKELKETMTEEDYSKFEVDDKGIHIVDIAAGDVIHWNRTNTDWIILLQQIQETAYFRADLRKCKYEIAIGENTYKVATKFKNKDTMTWSNASGKYWNDLDYTLEIYVTKNEETLEFFKRFTELKVNGNPYKVQGVDNMNVDGVIIVALLEDFRNTIQDEEDATIDPPKPDPDPTSIFIKGDSEIYPYDIKDYTIENAVGGSWSVDSSKVRIESQTDLAVTVHVITGRSGSFNLKYTRNGEEDIVMPITILSL